MSSLAMSIPRETIPTMNKDSNENTMGDDPNKGIAASTKSDSGAVANDKSSDGWDSQSDLYGHTEIDPVYRAKAHLLNEAIADIGMGKYQWCLFCVAGFGWFADSIWPLLSGLILSPTVNEFGFRAPYLSLALNIGLLVGAAFWGLGCDIIGRRWSFNISLFITSVFGIAAGGSRNFITLASLFAVVGVGVGGNMPVDSAVFLEFIPGSHQFLLTVMSIWWAFGQLLGALVAWPLISSFSCASASDCSSGSNKGWRYVLFTLGGLTFLLWGIRFFVFRLLESPRYLAARGLDELAVDVLQKVAKFNGSECRLTVEDLRNAGASAVNVGTHLPESEAKKRTGAFSLAEKSAKETLGHMKELFGSARMAWSTGLLVALWGIIGLASTLYNSFLPFLFASKGAVFGDGSVNITYRNTVIYSITGIPGAILAGWAVDLPLLGRKGTLAISCFATAVFLFATTTARNSNALLGWNCGYTFCSNIMYGVLYAVSPELFPAKDRGTGNGLVSIATRVFGVVAPIIALFANITTAVPVYISGALIILAGFIALLLPFEPRGKASL